MPQHLPSMQVHKKVSTGQNPSSLQFKLYTSRWSSFHASPPSTQGCEGIHFLAQKLNSIFKIISLNFRGMRKEKAWEGTGGSAVLTGGMQCGGWAEHRDAPSLSQHLTRFPTLLREEKWMKKHLLENKTEEEVSSLLSSSLQGDTLITGLEWPAAW